jgi:hypothetical protein
MSKNIFERVIDMKPVCDICGKSMRALYGCGWDYDILACSDPDCGADIVFSTSTEVKTDEITKP